MSIFMALLCQAPFALRQRRSSPLHRRTLVQTSFPMVIVVKAGSKMNSWILSELFETPPSTRPTAFIPAQPARRPFNSWDKGTKRHRQAEAFQKTTGLFQNRPAFICRAKSNSQNGEGNGGDFQRNRTVVITQERRSDGSELSDSRLPRDARFVAALIKPYFLFF